jgi:DNA polymerase-3 subunit gamma/tau
VRQIKDEVLFPPNTGKYKVYIIDEVHMLSTSAFNALLKTIEEPPPYIIFIFATTELHKVPATIKSRCQQFAFRLIPIETIKGILAEVCGELGIQAEDEALFWIARESTGSLRDAFTLFDQVVSFSGGDIRSDVIQEKLGLPGLERLNALAEACAANDTPRALSLVDEILGSGTAVEQVIIELAGFYRSLLLLKNGVTRESLLGHSPARFSSAVLERLDSIRLERALELLLDCYRDVRYSVSPRFELETAVSKLSWLDRWVSTPELRAAVDGAREVLGTAHAHSAAHGVKDGLPRPLAEPGFAPASAPSPSRQEPSSPEEPSSAAGEGPSLTEKFSRYIAARKNNADMPADMSGPEPGAGGPPPGDEEDVPLWSTLARTDAADAPVGETPAGDAPANAPAANAPGGEIAPQAQRIINMFGGAIITTGAIVSTGAVVSKGAVSTGVSNEH